MSFFLYFGDSISQFCFLFVLFVFLNVLSWKKIKELLWYVNILCSWIIFSSVIIAEIPHARKNCFSVFLLTLNIPTRPGVNSSYSKGRYFMLFIERQFVYSVFRILDSNKNSFKTELLDLYYFFNTGHHFYKKKNLAWPNFSVWLKSLFSLLRCCN